jgi:hypothetical protein
MKRVVQQSGTQPIYVSKVQKFLIRRLPTGMRDANWSIIMSWPVRLPETFTENAVRHIETQQVTFSLCAVHETVSEAVYPL